jgi:hypothetical protein
VPTWGAVGMKCVHLILRCLYSTASTGLPMAVTRSRKGMYGSRPAPALGTNSNKQEQ